MARPLALATTSLGFTRDPLNVTLDCADLPILESAARSYSAFTDISAPSASGGDVLEVLVDRPARDDLLAGHRGDVSVRVAGAGTRSTIGAALRLPDRILLVLGDRSQGSRVLVDRELRRLFALQFMQAGWLPMHAAAVTIASDRAVLLLGRKMAGKTTTSLRLLRSGANGVVANDKVFVMADGDTAPRCRSLPVSVGVRGDVVHLFPELAPALAAAADLHIDNRANDSRLLVPLPMLAECFGVEVRDTAEVALIAAVRFDRAGTESRCVPLAAADVATLLRRERLDFSPKWQSNWLGHGPAEHMRARGAEFVISSLGSVPAILAHVSAENDAALIRMLADAASVRMTPTE